MRTGYRIRLEKYDLVEEELAEVSRVKKSTVITDMFLMKKSFLMPALICLLLYPKLSGEKETYRGLASSWTRIPSRSLAGLHYVFKGFQAVDQRGFVKVTGPVVQITNGDQLGAKVFREGYVSEIDQHEFEEQQLLGSSVFEATTRTGTNVGTAFLVGPDLVLTNRHVMDLTAESREWPCGKFSIQLNHKDEKVGCRKVRYCSTRYDYCVVEMEKMSSGESIGFEVKPLRLTNKVKSDKDASLLHIGNAAGMGIQSSRGVGIKLSGGEFYHYAPTLGGSSGAPIFNDKREVIGINWGHTGGNFIDDAAFNRGVLSQTIYSELSRTHPHTLKDINSFKTWFYRNKGHRQVKIETSKTK
ncbi:MAG TPA: serine protease [Bacteriovoracaceae bacterium]|nr:serine protease [Bacteriovoracaceae bacterium]